jgi:magnesium transporter
MRRLLHQRFRKRGLPADALVAPQAETKPTITVYDYLPEKVDERKITDVEELLTLKDKPTPTWVDISGDHPLATLQRVGEILGIHPLTLEDIVARDQRPKVEEFDHYMFIALQKPTYGLPNGGTEFEQVSILLLPTTVISIRERVPGPHSPILSRMHHERNRIRRLGSDYLAYVLMDAIVDEYFFSLERMEDRIEEMEKELPEHPESETTRDIHRLRQEIIVLRKSVWPLREVIATLSKLESPLFDEGIKVYLKDLQDHIFQVVELLDVYRDMTKGMLDLYLSTMSHHMNQIMKTLTMIASIFIPLTLITGIYGMNFVHMPELQWRYGFPIVIAVMVVIGLGMLYWFRRRRWL